MKADPIIALHGFMGCGEDFTALKKHFSQHLWHCLNLHQMENPSIENLMGHLHSLIDSFQSKPILLGYSFGGRMALQYAVRFSEKISRLILISTTPGIEDPLQRRKRIEADNLLADHIETIGTKTFFEEWINTRLIKTQMNIPERIRQPIFENRLKNSPKPLAHSLRTMGTGSMEPVWRYLNQIDCPTNIFVGEKDLKFLEIGKQMHKGILNSTYDILPDAGHCAHLENLEDFVGSLKQKLPKE